MRISDWSSDVCSSDLAGALVLAVEQAEELEVLDQLHHTGGVAIEVRMALVAGGAVDDEGIGRDLPAEAVVAVALGQQGAVEQAARLQHALDLRHRAAADAGVAAVDAIDRQHVVESTAGRRVGTESVTRGRAR